jgi:protein-tyrosine phosphatase
MISSVLVVCVGNVCRSPVGARLLASACPGIRVESAGIGALIGHTADKDAAKVASEHGVNVEGHIARQFSGELAKDFDLILVLEKGHRKAMASLAPEVSGKTMLFGKWMGDKDIPDPYRKSLDFHVEVFRQIQYAAQAWAAKLG